MLHLKAGDGDFFSANHGTGFTDEMRMRIACDLIAQPYFESEMVVGS